MVGELRADCRLPIGVGFRHQHAGEAAAVAGYADAVVVGSALVRLIETNAESPGLVSEVGGFLRALKGACRRSEAPPRLRRRHSSAGLQTASSPRLHAAKVTGPERPRAPWRGHRALRIGQLRRDRMPVPRRLPPTDERLPAYARLALRPRGGQGHGFQARARVAGPPTARRPAECLSRAAHRRDEREGLGGGDARRVPRRRRIPGRPVHPRRISSSSASGSRSPGCR
jgi:hypothetical protein